MSLITNYCICFLVFTTPNNPKSKNIKEGSFFECTKKQRTTHEMIDVGKRWKTRNYTKTKENWKNISATSIVYGVHIIINIYLRYPHKIHWKAGTILHAVKDECRPKAREFDLADFVTCALQLVSIKYWLKINNYYCWPSIALLLRIFVHKHTNSIFRNILSRQRSTFAYSLSFPTVFGTLLTHKSLGGYCIAKMPLHLTSATEI